MLQEMVVDKFPVQIQYIAWTIDLQIINMPDLYTSMVAQLIDISG